MSEIDLIEFGKLCANVQATHDTVKEMNTKQGEHDDDIIALKHHNTMIKKAFKWIGSGIAAVFSLIAWIASSN